MPTLKASIRSCAGLEVVFSRRRRNQVERIELVRLKREGGPQSLCFSSRPFVLCGLPVRPLPAGQLIYERKNGSFVLHALLVLWDWFQIHFRHNALPEIASSHSVLLPLGS